jgi:protoheme IX farnesyltransferase
VTALAHYYQLTKPKVVYLMIITAWVGMILAISNYTPDVLKKIAWGTVGIALSAGSGAVFNHLIERHIDARMHRTEARPVASGKLSLQQASWFGLGIGILGLSILLIFTNLTATILTFLSLFGYAIVYTVYLKRNTPQNIVIGGAAGAAPPLLGWSVISGTVDPHALLLVLIIFAWTPPHFWALAIHRRHEYAKTPLPMLPITHGVPYTKLNIILYTLLLILVSILPYLTHMSGLIYLLTALGLGIGFFYHAYILYQAPDEKNAMITFGYSILYLFGLFIGLVLDHFFISN